MHLTSGQKRVVKILSVTVVLLLMLGGGVLLREYLIFKKIQATLRSPTMSAAETELRAKATESDSEAPLVSAISRSADGSLVRARANFSAFKQKVEAHPEILQQWGRVGWKILGDIPALCVRGVSGQSPFAALGVKSGDCITQIDGESINQPMRNMGIWLTLAARTQLKIDTLREGRHISYELVRK